MNFDPVAFRAAFPAFADMITYPDAMVLGWFSIAQAYLASSWAMQGTTLTTAQQLLVAHIGTMMTNAMVDGSATGAVVSASEGSVSASFAPPPIKSSLDYYLSSSTYGIQLSALLDILAAGGDYVGGLPERSAFRKVGGVFC